MATTLRNKLNQERYAAEEKAAEERRNAPALARIKSMQEQIEELTAARVKQAFSLPLSRLLQKIQEIDDVRKHNPALADRMLEDFEDADVSNGVVFVPRVEGQERVGIAEFRAVHKFVTEELPKTGYAFEDAGGKRFGIYLEVQSQYGVDFTNRENVRKAFNRLLNLNCFAEGEVTFDATRVKKPEPVAKPKPEPDVDIEQIDTTTKEGRALAKRQLEKDYFKGEVKPIWNEWRASLLNNFGYVMDENVQRHAYQIFMDLNLSFLDRRSYDRVRLILVGRGLMPETCLTPEDKLARSIENASTPTENYFQRRNIHDAISAVKSLNPIPEPKE